MNYDRNMVCSGRMAKQTVELTFQVDDYFYRHTATVGGNAMGLSIIESAVSAVEDALDDNITLTRENGDTLLCELWEFKLEDMLVGARIVAIEPNEELEKKLFGQRVAH